MIFGEALAEAGNNFLGVIQTQSGLGQKRELLGLFDNYSASTAAMESTTTVPVRSFAGGANDFLMVFVADQDDGATFPGRISGLPDGLW